MPIDPLHASKLRKSGTRRLPQEILGELATLSWEGTGIVDDLREAQSFATEKLAIPLYSAQFIADIFAQWYGDADPLPLFNASAEALEQLMANPTAAPTPEQRGQLGKIFNALEMLIAKEKHHMKSANEEVMGSRLPGLLGRVLDREPLDEKGIRARLQEDSAIFLNAHQTYLHAQALVVELCDYYDIPTRRHPPERERT